MAKWITKQLKRSTAKGETIGVDYFKSTEQTGTGSEQNIAHSLGRTPALVIVLPTESSGAFDYAEGTHDATNVKVTATSGIKFKVVAL